ncbi:DUF3298 and DUF4163 domain-containing protein [Anoxybacterium hadale]|uniref:DUF3298 and DUF4163 domain-containing protein n=1 Tax=Anoxybacterium hadale TaxID=3408580 RepID=A0ACD1A7V0_9FIRM|nr:DUF3298 and DUF4163 domain-containing protein [Clostridiales bacterium]
MKKKLEFMKEEYMRLNASEELKARVAETMNKQGNKHFTLRRRTAGLAACIAVLLIVSLNVSQSLAATMADMPGMSGIVRVLTFGRYAVEDKGFHADIVTPHIEGLLDKELEEKLNNDFKEYADSVIAAFEKDVKELKEEFPDSEIHYGIDSGYEIRTDNDKILAIDIYLVNTVGSSSTTHKFYTIDKASGKLITLKSLFKDGADYVSVLNSYLVGEMKRQNEADLNMFWVDDPEMGSFESIRQDQNFYINEDGLLVICFDKYEIAPGASGSPEFVIPEDIIRDIRK